jgi:AraC family transcriptional regulator
MLDYVSQPDFALEPTTESDSGETRSFDADVLTKQTGTWTGGKGVLIDRQTRGERTHFNHRLRRHTLALHLEGANTRTNLRYDGGASVTTGSTLGQIMLIPAEHPLEGWSDYPARIRHMLLLLDPEMIDAGAREDTRRDRPTLSYRVDLADGVIADRMRALQLEFDHPGLMGRLYVESLSNEIAVRLVRAQASAGGSTTLARGGLAPKRLRLVRDYIDTNLAEEITLADLAAIAGVSSTHFCRAFHRSTGIASHQYLIRRRVERAKALLAEGDLPIAQIALAVGFGNQSHMTTHFRRVVGTTPRRFRDGA